MLAVRTAVGGYWCGSKQGTAMARTPEVASGGALLSCMDGRCFPKACVKVSRRRASAVWPIWCPRSRQRRILDRRLRARRGARCRAAHSARADAHVCMRTSATQRSGMRSAADLSWPPQQLLAAACRRIGATGGCLTAVRHVKLPHGVPYRCSARLSGTRCVVLALVATLHARPGHNLEAAVAVVVHAQAGCQIVRGAVRRSLTFSGRRVVLRRNVGTHAAG